MAANNMIGTSSGDGDLVGREYCRSSDLGGVVAPHGVIVGHVRYRRRMRRRTRPPKMGERGWFPDHTAERRIEFTRTTPGERVAEAIELSRLGTRMAALGHRQRAR